MTVERRCETLQGTERIDELINRNYTAKRLPGVQLPPLLAKVRYFMEYSAEITTLTFLKISTVEEEKPPSPTDNEAVRSTMVNSP